MRDTVARLAGPALLQMLRHPGRFAWQTLKAFRANQGLLLAGALAYYALLSIVPLLLLCVVALTHLVDQAGLLLTLRQYLGWLLPGYANAIVAELANFLEHRDTVGWVLLATMLFFSSLAFAVLENAMTIIFHHRSATRRRHPLISALLPYGFVMCLAIGLLIVTVVTGALQGIGRENVQLFGREWSLGGLSGLLLYLLGFAGEVIALAAIYMVMPVGRLSLHHAVFGAIVAALLWEATRHALVWYFATLSQIGIVYGSLATAIAVLLSLELGGTLLLLGAQVIAELERIGREQANQPRLHLVTAAVLQPATPGADTPRQATDLQ